MKQSLWLIAGSCTAGVSAVLVALLIHPGGFALLSPWRLLLVPPIIPATVAILLWKRTRFFAAGVACFYILMVIILVMK